MLESDEAIEDYLATQPLYRHKTRTVWHSSPQPYSLPSILQCGFKA